MNKLNIKNKYKTIRNLVLITFAFIGFNLQVTQISAESIFNLMGLVNYHNGNTVVAGDASTPNTFANARAYRSNIDNNFKNSNKPSDRHIYGAQSGDPAYFLFDVGSSAWNPVATTGDTSIIVLETYQGQNGWVGPSYVAGAKSEIDQNKLNANGIDYSNSVMEQIPTPELKSDSYAFITVGWNALWDNTTGAEGGVAHNSIVGYSVYRSDNQGPFEFMGSVNQNAGQEVTYQDSAVILGHNYIYKIRVQFEWNAHSPAYYETTAESAQSAELSLAIPNPDRLAFTTTEQTITAGTNSSVITVQTRDEDGNDTPVQSDITLSLSSNSPGLNKVFYFAENNICSSTVVTSLQILAGSSAAQFCYYDESASDTNWIISVDKSIPADPDWEEITQNIIVNNANLASFDISLSTPQNNQVPFNGVNTLTAYDSFGNVVKNFDASTNNITFTFDPVDGTLSGLSGPSNNQLVGQSDFINGVANIDALTFTGTSGLHTFTATSANSITTTSEPVLINPSVADHLSIVVPANVTAGTQFNITSITALDEFNNIDTNFNGSKLVSYTGASNSLSGSQPVFTTSVVFTNGTATTPLATVLVKAETISLDVTVAGISGQSNEFTVEPSSATELTLIAPTTAAAGVNFDLTSITAYDQFKNIDTNYNGIKTLNYSGPSNGPVAGSPTYTTQVTFANGVSTTQLVTQLVKKEETTITVTDAVISGESDNINVSAGEVGNISYISGNNQSAKINTFLTEPLVVEITDTFGNPKNNYPVNFVITQGNGYLATETPLTSTDGRASQNFRLGTVAGVNSDQVQVQIPSAVGSPIIFNATATPNDAANLLVTAPTTATAGIPFNLSLSIVDEEGNLITNYSGVKTVTYSGANNSPDNTAPIYTTEVEFVNGLAQNVATTLFNTESVTLNLSIDLDTLSGTSNAVNVNPAETKNFVVVAPNTVQTGDSFNLISIKTIDDFGNDSIDYSGTKTLTYSGPDIDPVWGNAPIYTTIVEFENGIATTTLATTLYKAETVRIKVEEGLIEGTSNEITVIYTEDYIIYYVSGNEQTGIAGQDLEEPIVVKILDSEGNPAPNQEVTFTVTNGNGSVTTNTINQETGEISTVWKLGTVVGSQSVTASVNGVTTTIQFTATAVSDEASILVINPLTTNTYAGYSTEEINVCLQDQFGNQVVTNINRTINLVSSSGTGQFALTSAGPWVISSTDIVTGQSCVGLFYKDSTAGSFTFTASSNAISSGLMTINVLALVPTTIQISPTSFTINENNTQQLSAIVYDQFNQSMTSVNLTWEMNNTSAGTITQNGLYYPVRTAGTFTDAIKVSYSGLESFSTPTVVLNPVNNPDPEPQPAPVLPVQPVIIPPTQPEPIPTEEVTIIVDQDYFGEEEGEIPIKVEVPAITVLSPKQGSLILSNGNVSISGMSTPEQVIVVRDGENNTLGSVTSDKNGYWKIFVSRNKFSTDQGTITATVFKSNATTLPLTFDFKPRSIFEYLMGFIFQ